MSAQENAETRVEEFARGAELGFIARALAERREEVLTRWTKAATKQPFHGERAEPPDIRPLFDGLVSLLAAAAPRSIDPPPPLDDPTIAQAAREHVKRRLAQGLRADEVVTEFRLLRQEIGRALRFRLGESTLSSDILAAVLIIDDAIDGAISVALSSLDDYIEEVRAEVLGSAIHDLRQPITAIKANLDLAVRALGQPDKNLELTGIAVQRAEDGTSQLAELVGTLSGVSRVASGRIEPNRTEVDLADLVHKTVEQAGTDLARRVRLDVAAGLDTTGFWDPAHLGRVVMNLLSNAAKYSPADTQIDVAIEPRDGNLSLAVQDQGIGLTPEQLSTLFQRFARTAHEPRPVEGGLGLGLYLSRGLIDAHGGRIWAESPGLGKGTTFFVELPRKPSAEK